METYRQADNQTDRQTDKPNRQRHTQTERDRDVYLMLDHGTNWGKRRKGGNMAKI